MASGTEMERRSIGERRRVAEHARCGEGRGIERDDRRRLGRRADVGHHAGPTDPDRADVGERRLDLADQAVGVDVEQPVAATRAADGHDRAVRQEPVGRAVEDPSRVGELGLQPGEQLELRSLGQAVQVPPAGAVADEVQRAVRRPLGLGDRLVVTAGGQVALSERAVLAERRDAQPGRVPWHVRVVPLEPRQPQAVGRRARRGQEVGALVQHALGRRSPSSGTSTMAATGIALAAVVLADGEEPTARRIEAQVGVAVRTVRRDRLRRVVARIQPVQATVDDVREHRCPAGDGVCTATVLVDTRPDVERRRREVGGVAVAGAPDQDAPAALGRATLDPVDVVAVDPRIAQPDDGTDDVVDTDRRWPAAVRQHGRPRRDRLGGGRVDRGFLLHGRTLPRHPSGRSGGRAGLRSVLPGADVLRLLGGHRLELDAQRRQLEAGDLGVDRLGHDVHLRLELAVVLGDVLGATAPGSRSSCP